jgi:hypothetical protein
MSGSEQDKVDQLIKLLEGKKKLSASDIAAVEKLLAAGAGVVNGRGKTGSSHYLWPPLFTAACFSNVDAAAMLIAAGADVNAVTT